MIGGLAVAFTDACPKCGGETTFGYGLMGGGMGAYVVCLTDDCDFFEKEQDPPEEDETAGKDGDR